MACRCPKTSHEGAALNLFDLAGKAAIDTGSTRGIGRAVAEALIEAGARVVISTEDAADTARVAAELEGKGFNLLGLDQRDVLARLL